MNQDNTETNIYPSKYISSNDNYISKIKNMFSQIIEINKKNNVVKSSLFNSKNFDSKELFKEIDINQKGYINNVDVINYLKKSSINFNFDEQVVRRLIKQYDKHSHFKLTYDNFNTMISPSNNLEKEEKEENAKNMDKNELFYKIINNEFYLIRMINDKIIDIKKCENFITYEAFLSISNNETDIDKTSMKSFMGNKYEENDINFLIYYLDMDNDGLISYDEFEDFFVTLSLNQN